MPPACDLCGAPISVLHGSYCDSCSPAALGRGWSLETVKDIRQKARLVGIDWCVESVEGRLATMRALNAVPAAVAMLEEVLVFLRAGRERVVEGRGFHPTTPVGDR